jgi:O-antigen/teichoic acid export membrane protein
MIDSNVDVVDAPESARTRYIAKFSGGIVSAAAGLGQQALLSRALGPSVFGQMNFVFSHFDAVFSMLDLGVASGTAARIAQKPERSLVARRFFLKFFIFTAFCILLYAMLTQEISWLKLKIWPDIDPGFVLPGFFYAVSFSILNRFTQFADATGIAAKVEISRALRALVAISLLLLLSHFNALNSSLIMLLLGTTFAGLSVRIFFLLKQKDGVASVHCGTLTQSQTEEKSYLLNYCKPLVAYSIFGSLFSVFDRWILQYSSGSVEQSFFSLALQMANICFVFTGPFTGILHREVALCYASGQIDKLRTIFLTGTRRLFALSAIIACFMSINAKEILHLMSGDKYASASLSMTLMFLYPIQQMYGQISSLCLLATGQTKTYMKVGIVTAFLSSVLGYILMGRNDWIVPGLNLGSSGLAIKYLCGQFLLTTLLNLAISNQAHFSFLKLLVSDILIFAGFYVVAFGVRAVGLTLSGLTSFGLLGLGITGTVYVGCCGAVLIVFGKFFHVPKIGQIAKEAKGLFKR